MPRRRNIGIDRPYALVRAMALACLLTMYAAFSPAVHARSSGSTIGGEIYSSEQPRAQDIFAQLFAQFRRAENWLQRSYDKRPAVVVGLSAIAILPILALAGLLIHRSRYDDDTIERSDLNSPVGEAWLEVDGGRRIALPEQTGILQIGSVEDNDVCFTNSDLDHYHAVVERTRSAGIVITDVSDPDGPGLVVNGERRNRARLASGDVVELGGTRMKFGMAA